VAWARLNTLLDGVERAHNQRERSSARSPGWSERSVRAWKSTNLLMRGLPESVVPGRVGV